MKLNFKQGIIRYQTDISNNPTFLQKTVNGVTLNVSPDPTLLTFSHGDHNYTFEENTTIENAWQITQNRDSWIYWDLDIITGERTFGITYIKPVYSINKPAGVNDRHWFDLQTKSMKVYTGSNYVTKLRVFAAFLDDGGVISHYETGSQVGLNESCYSGMILYDEDNKPLKKFNRRGDGAFITTETPLSSQFSKIINYKLENEIKEGIALEYIPKFFCMSHKENSKYVLASYITPIYPCIGISSEDMHTGEARTIYTNGYIKNELWDWPDSPGRLLFVGESGQITINVPQLYSIQNIGYIVSPNVIYVDIKQIIYLG